jgi:AcrR family transcriptional regulator
MPNVQRRPRNSAATREAILQSAIRHFARTGYDGVGVRQIAQDAGVTAMLVNRYFGSKERLFAEAVETAFAEPVFIAEHSETLAGDAAAALVARTGPDGLAPAPFLIMLYSVANPAAVEIVRDAVERHVGRRLARQLGAPQAGLRSELMLSVISGVLLMRAVVGTRALGKARPDDIARLLESVFAVLVDGTPG